MDWDVFLSDFDEEVPGCLCVGLFDLETRTFLAIEALDGCARELADRAVETTDSLTSRAFSLSTELLGMRDNGNKRELLVASDGRIQMLRLVDDANIVLIAIGSESGNLGMLLTRTRIFFGKITALIHENWTHDSASRYRSQSGDC